VNAKLRSNGSHSEERGGSSIPVPGIVRISGWNESIDDDGPPGVVSLRLQLKLSIESDQRVYVSSEVLALSMERLHFPVGWALNL